MLSNAEAAYAAYTSDSVGKPTPWSDLPTVNLPAVNDGASRTPHSARATCRGSPGTTRVTTGYLRTGRTKMNFPGTSAHGAIAP